MVFAVRLDTFPRDKQTKTFYIGSNDPAEFERLRRRLLQQCRVLPVSGEYIHRDAFDVAARYGKDIFVAIERFGTDRLPLFFAAKSRLDAIVRRTRFLPRTFADLLLQAISCLLPQHLPARIRDWRDRYVHHLILKVADAGIAEARDILESMYPSATGDWFECTPQEAHKAFLQRFAVAGAAIRYRAVQAHPAGEIVALDVALRRNDRDWPERLPPALAAQVDKALYYGHFLCHVFHQDYVLKPGCDPHAFEHDLMRLLDARRARYPAEHNVGHHYPADDHLAAHYRALDPGNRVNPGIGRTSRERGWR